MEIPERLTPVASPADTPARRFVSIRNQWDDLEWFLDNPTPGSVKSTSTIRWDIELPDWTLLTDPKWAALLESLRCFVWSLFNDPRGGKALKPGSASALYFGVKHLVRWMVSKNIHSLAGLSMATSQQYIDDVLATTIAAAAAKSEVDTDEAISLSYLYQRFHVWTLLWRQAGALVDMAQPYMPEAPFDGESPHTLSKKLATVAEGWIPPLPDEVALPIMNAANRLIWEPADDVIAAHNAYVAYMEEHNWSARAKQKVGAIIGSMIFTTLPGESKPWLPTLIQAAPWGATERIEFANPLRAIVEDVRNACAIVIQSEAGLRIGELCGIPVGLNEDGLPVPVEIRRSKTGLNELFFIKSVLAKTEEAPREVKWLLGSRPVGTAHIPAPVRAIQVLNQLYVHWREFSNSEKVRNSLFVNFDQTNGFPRVPEMVLAQNAKVVSYEQKEFIQKYVDLTGLADKSAQDESLVRYRETRGCCVKSHQWRKSFAMYCFRVDKRMLPAIAQQFQHLSLAMTEQGYIGSNPTLLDTFDSVRMQRTVKFFYEQATGKSPLTGRLASVIDENRAELVALVKNKTKEDGWHAVAHWCVENDLRIWFSNYGKCCIGINPAQSRCHEVAKTSSWMNREPNYEARQTTVCLGCGGFAIDREHLPYWQLRYTDNLTSWERAKAMGLERDYRVVKERADQAAIVLHALGALVSIGDDDAS